MKRRINDVRRRIENNKYKFISRYIETFHGQIYREAEQSYGIIRQKNPNTKDITKTVEFLLMVTPNKEIPRYYTTKRNKKTLSKDSGKTIQLNIPLMNMTAASRVIGMTTTTAQEATATATATAQEQTTTAQEATATAQEQTTTAQEATATAQEQTTTAQEATATAQEQTTTAQEATATAQEQTTTAQEATATAQEQTTTVQEATTTAQEQTTTPQEATAQLVPEPTAHEQKEEMDLDMTERVYMGILEEIKKDPNLSVIFNDIDTQEYDPESDGILNYFVSDDISPLEMELANYGYK